MFHFYIVSTVKAQAYPHAETPPRLPRTLQFLFSGHTYAALFSMISITENCSESGG